LLFRLRTLFTGQTGTKTLSQAPCKGGWRNRVRLHRSSRIEMKPLPMPTEEEAC
jgi:hypothetical protein